MVMDEILDELMAENGTVASNPSAVEEFLFGLKVVRYPNGKIFVNTFPMDYKTRDQSKKFKRKKDKVEKTEMVSGEEY